jgi:4-diphosphocytidyl-2C-methyl-D-erythritol kinase
METTVEARAKVNLYLGVEPLCGASAGGAARRHNLRSVFTTVSLHDTLRFTFSQGGRQAAGGQTGQARQLACPRITIRTTADPEIRMHKIALEYNIITKAIRAFCAALEAGGADAARDSRDAQAPCEAQASLGAQASRGAQDSCEAQASLGAQASHETRPSRGAAALSSPRASSGMPHSGESRKLRPQAAPRQLPADHITVELTKHIPSQAGLGGGSADAAATILALAELCGLSPVEDAAFLQAVAASVGSDVPFLLSGGCALMGGFGDMLERRITRPDPPLDLVLVKPEGGVSTAAAYRGFDAAPAPAASLQALLTALEGPDASPQSIAPHLANNLETAAATLLPAIPALKAELSAQPGVLAVLLCGSGSTVFGLCENRTAAEAAAAHFAKTGLWSRAVTTC